MRLARPLIPCIVLSAVVALPSHAQETKDMSAELRRLVQENPELGQALENGLEHQKKKDCIQCNNGQSSYWYGKTLENIYAFFKDWQTHTPGAGMKSCKDSSNIGSHDLNFADYVTAPEGYLAVQTPLFRSWMIDFINARKQYLESPESAQNIEKLTQCPGWGLDDYVVPEGGFQSWIAFFTRQLRPGTRTFDHKENPCVLNSPVDAGFAPASSILAEDIDYETLRAKGDILSVREVFNNHPFASRFRGGSALTFWLEFNNTHWFVAPVDGTVVASGVLAGLYSVEFAHDNLPAHKRGFLLIDTEKFGLVGLLVVGLQTVSEINLTVGAGDTVRKGDPLGYFNYGGSTAMIFYEKGKAELSRCFGGELTKCQHEKNEDARKECLKKANAEGINTTVSVGIGQELLYATSAECRPTLPPNCPS